MENDAADTYFFSLYFINLLSYDIFSNISFRKREKCRRNYKINMAMSKVQWKSNKLVFQYEKNFLMDYALPNAVLITFSVNIAYLCESKHI